MARWKIDITEFKERLKITRKLENVFSLPRISEITQVIPLRDIAAIHSIVPMEKSFLLHMLHLVKTKDGQHPFKNALIRLVKLDPRVTRVGQRFVYRDKYVAFMENVPGIFDNFLIPCGLGDLGAYAIFGLDKNNIPSLALYIPPLVERHDSHYVLMDGIHRNYIARQQGSTPNVIIIYDVSVPFPCEAKIWKETQVISLADRPIEVKDRFFNLNDQLMRDLKFLGIDG